MTPGRDYTGDMHLAHVLADQADSISLDRFRALDLQVDTKPDLTPVTDADRAVEEQLRIMLARARTRDAVLGEEMGTTGRGPRRWVLDPIDGTKNFVRGVPVWATLIALFDGDEPVVGLVSAPALNRRWWAAKDVGAWSGRRRNWRGCGGTRQYSPTRCRQLSSRRLATNASSGHCFRRSGRGRTRCASAVPSPRCYIIREHWRTRHNPSRGMLARVLRASSGVRPVVRRVASVCPAHPG